MGRPDDPVEKPYKFALAQKPEVKITRAINTLKNWHRNCMVCTCITGKSINYSEGIMTQSKLLKKFAISVVCATCLASSAAFAAPIPTPCSVVNAGNGNDTVGNADTDDLTLNSNWSTSCAFSNVNPAGSGNAGDTSGFANSFTTYSTTNPSTWDTLGKIEQNSGSFTSNNLLITLNQNGTWSIKNTSAGALMLDLVFDIHAGSGSTAFLFNDQTIAAGQTLNGTWSIEWLNNGGKIPDFSNAVFFDRDLGTPGSGGSNGGQVPEPGSLALMGLGLLGAVSLRKRSKA